MDYAYKITTHGRFVMAACMALEKPFHITRVAFGSGRVGEDVNLADIHELVTYVSDGAVAERTHRDDRLNITIQYANADHPETPVFLLSEFIVYVQDPETEEETDLLYGNLGDYRQPVPAYYPAYPPSVFNFPLTIILSSELSVQVSAPAGLVTWDDLRRLTDSLAIVQKDIAIPAEGWEEDPRAGYCVRLDLPMRGVTDRLLPSITIAPEGEAEAAACGLCPAAETGKDLVRLRAVKPPEAEIPASVRLARNCADLILPGGDLSVSIATMETPGLIKPGPGLLIAPDGTLSVDAASEEDIGAALESLQGNEPGQEEG